MFKKIFLISLVCIMIFTLLACVKDDEQKIAKICEICNKNEATVTTRGTMFDDNHAHHLCKSCWDRYRRENNVKDGGNFDG